MTATAPAQADARKKYGLRQTIAALGQPRVAGMAALGFSSGMPFMLTGGIFGYWLRDAGAELTAIGFLSWVGLAYTFKVFWAPMVDKLSLPVLGKLGQRRSWALLVQMIIAAALLAMAMVGPNVGQEATKVIDPTAAPAVSPEQLVMLGVLALVVAFASATQDIAIDAWRIEEAQDSDELGTFTAAYQLGYRVALLVTDALILVFAARLGWPISYSIMALLMGVGLFATLRMPEPKAQTAAARTPSADVATGARTRTAAIFFLVAAGLCWLLPYLPHWKWLEMFAVLGNQSTFGTGFSIACVALAAGAFVRIPQTWIAGAALIVAVVLVAFYGAISGQDVIGGAPLFWPTVLCLIGAALAAPPRIFDAFLGPLIEFFRHHGWFAAVMLLMISVYRLPEFVIGPVAGPFYSDLGLSKDVVGGVRASVGMIAAFAGIAAGGVLVAALGFKRALVIGAVLQGLGVASFALLAFNGPSIGLFSFAMAADNFCYALAGVVLITYMSSLTSVGYTATQYALLSSIYTLFGKFLKGFSGAVVDGFQQSGRTLMESYGLFYVGAGLIAAPALVLCLVILARQKPAAAPTTA
jgi:MFS transporter, PAT family, beta-lactamase induction signal transducer AmpG